MQNMAAETVPFPTSLDTVSLSLLPKLATNAVCIIPNWFVLRAITAQTKPANPDPTALFCTKSTQSRLKNQLQKCTVPELHMCGLEHSPRTTKRDGWLRHNLV